MTSIEAKAVVNARNEVKRAKKELQRAQLHETRYRGIPTLNNWLTRDVHGEFTYRGVTYVK